MRKSKIPVTIITGFLGAGKTTLLNNLIEDHPDKKFAIIENEFGDIPIDQELVVSADDNIFELSNGCICCSLNTELGELLARLMDERYDFNHLIIETTGIAEPDSIAAAFIGGNKESTFYLDGTICLADAQHIEQNLRERGEAARQVSFADVILLNKIDLVDERGIENAKKVIKTENPGAPVYETSFGKIDRDLLRLHAYDGRNLENTFLNPQFSLRPDDHKTHHHHDDLAAHSFEISEPLIAEKFEHWVNMLLFLSGDQLYRIKGVLNLEGENRKIIFQSVRSSSKIELGSEWREGEVRKTMIVFIGQGIKRENIEKGLYGCVRKPKN